MKRGLYVSFLPLAIFSVFRWRQVDSLLHIPAEIRHGREVHLFSDFRQGEFLLAEQVGDFLHGEAVNPVRGGFPAYFLAYFRQVMGRDTKARGIIPPYTLLIYSRARKKGYPCWDIWRNSSMLSNLMCLPLVLIKPSLAKVDRVRMALLVVMLAREAMSSLLSDTSKTLSSSMP